MLKIAPTNPKNDYGVYRGSSQSHNLVIENVIEVRNQRVQIYN